MKSIKGLYYYIGLFHKFLFLSSLSYLFHPHIYPCNLWCNRLYCHMYITKLSNLVFKTVWKLYYNEENYKKVWDIAEKPFIFAPAKREWGNCFGPFSKKKKRSLTDWHWKYIQQAALLPPVFLGGDKEWKKKQRDWVWSFDRAR